MNLVAKNDIKQFFFTLVAKPVIEGTFGSLVYDSGTSPTVSVNASGIPMPAASWWFGSSRGGSGSVTDLGNNKYKYSYQMPKLE